MTKSKFDPQKHRRHSIRLPNYDYSQPGAYFVTIVAWHRKCLFGEVIGGEMKLNQVGKIVRSEWDDLSKRFRYIELGAFIIMPNHIHGILIFGTDVGATRQDLKGAHSDNRVLHCRNSDDINHKGSPLPHGPKPASLGVIIAQFKSRVTKRLWKIPSFQSSPIWQRNYYEHITRNEQNLQSKTDYINANPLLWEQDDENPLNIHPRGVASV